MADRVLITAWGAPVRGREDRAIEVFNDAVGILGRMQQEGRIEKFDIVLLAPNHDLGGFMSIQGTAAQLAAVREDDEFIHNTVDAELCVDGMRHLEGYTNEGIAGQMAIYSEAIARMPQHA